MTKYAYIKNRKNFYVHGYRRAVKLTMMSLVINCLLLFAIYVQYISQPGHDFYATNGSTAPIKLAPMSQANYSSKSLLPSDQVIDRVTKGIPR